MIRRWLRRIADPVFDCENCIGMAHYGCECSYKGASAPGVGSTRRQSLARWLLAVMP